MQQYAMFDLSMLCLIFTINIGNGHIGQDILQNLIYFIFLDLEKTGQGDKKKFSQCFITFHKNNIFVDLFYLEKLNQGHRKHLS